MAEDYVHCEDGLCLARIDLTVYHLESVLKSAYRFTDRCYLHLQTTAAKRVEVRMRSKHPEHDVATLMRAFFNDLLDQRLRQLVAEQTVGMRDLILAHALSKTPLVRPELETAVLFSSAPNESPRPSAAT